MRNIATEDIQHDLAMSYAAKEFNDVLTTRFEHELRRRKAPLPVPDSCEWVYDPYARFKKRLQYTLAAREKDTHET